MSGRPSCPWSKGCLVTVGLSREAAGDGSGGIVEILKKEDFGDDW